MSLRVALVDDHKPFRERLRILLGRAPDIEIVAEASTGDELLAIALTTRMDVACMDIRLPGMNGIDATRRLLAIQPGVRVIGLSAYAEPHYVEAMLAAGAVDCLQADVTRCQGITGFLRVAALCQARSLELSAHCGPAIHLHPCCAAPALRHLEYFPDHVRVERRLFDGVPEPVDGVLRPDLTRPGNGLELRRADAERYAR